jgi:hypothetical protein
MATQVKLDTPALPAHFRFLVILVNSEDHIGKSSNKQLASKSCELFFIFHLPSDIDD